jgi:predicted 2-oxoglutarate/Fe(II)-dependent dioxygenase YbiX
LPAQAEQLISVAQRAPFGRGEQTLVDTDVRRTWQIDAARVRIHGQGWARSLAGIVQSAAVGLGETGPVAAELYKLLVYDDGSFFVSHRDTEKTDGMFATLVVVLPSNYTGGELLVRHQGREVRFDLRCPDPSQAAFAAFYADCLHEVLPVTSGCRLALIYILSRREPGERPGPPSYETETEQLTGLLRRWAQDEEGTDDLPDKLIFPLDHAYSQASLSFDARKGADAARAATLVAAARAADCDLHLALLVIDESGSAEYTGNYRSYRRGRSDDAAGFDVLEVIERTETLSDWRRPDGGAPGLGVLPFDPDEISPPAALENWAPDNQSFREATGNEGASFERSYRKAALVLWPSRWRLTVVNHGGLPATLPYLADLSEQWAASGEDHRSPLWSQAHELSGHMLASWPIGHRRMVSSPGDAGLMLTLLSRLGDTERIGRFLMQVAAAGAYGRGHNEGVLQAIHLLPRGQIVELLERVVAGNAANMLGACSDLLAQAVTVTASRRLDLEPAFLRPVAAMLVGALPGDPAGAPQTPLWSMVQAMESGVVVDIVTALDTIDSGLAGVAVNIFLAWPKTYDMDTVLIPAVVKLSGPARAATTAFARCVPRAWLICAPASPYPWRRRPIGPEQAR